MRAIRIAAIVVVLMLATVSASTRRLEQSAPPTDSAVLSGSVVTNESSPRPLRRATVWARREGVTIGAMAAVTDDDGRFVVTGLPAGRYRLTAYKGAHVPAVYGSTRPGFQPGSSPSGTLISLGEGQRVADLMIRMTRGAVLTGVVRDAEGQPARNMRVDALALVRGASGAKELMSIQAGDPGGALTDGRGVYRLFGLPPGDYVIGATPMSVPGSLEPTREADLVRAAALIRSPNQSPTTNPNAPVPLRRPTVGFAPIYFPGTSVLASASIVTVAAGEERGGLDFAVLPVSNAIVTGTVRMQDGEPAPGYFVRSILEGLSPNAAPGPSALTDAAGAFKMTGVAPGNYQLDVTNTRAARAGQVPAFSALVPVTIGNDDVRVDISLVAGSTITGRLVFEATSLTRPQNVSSWYVGMTPRSGPTYIGRLPIASIGQDGQFTMIGVAPMKYTLTASMLPPPSRAQGPWYLKSATLNGVDAIDLGVDVQPGIDLRDLVVTFTDHPTEISGTLTNAQGQPAPEYFIIVFPADQTQWTWQNRRIQQTRPAKDGAFAVRGLPAGDYLIGAVTDADTNAWFEPAFLKALAGGAIKITLADGEKRSQNLSVK